MDFMHIEQVPDYHQFQPVGFRNGFRPLELSIYVDNHLSPILPHFKNDDIDIAIRKPEHAHMRSQSSLSHFTVPRKPLSRCSIALLLSQTSAQLQRPVLPIAEDDSLDKSVQRPLNARLRAYTAPAIQLERVVSKLQEKDELDRKLRDIGTVLEERQSVYRMSMSAPSSPGEDNRPVSIYQSEGRLIHSMIPGVY